MLIGDHPSQEEILQEIQIHCLEWQYVKEHGTASVIWSDGRELNFIRDKIIRLKERLENVPDLEVEETPPRMSELFMVNPGKIEEEAKEALKTYENDKNYRYIISHRNRLPEQYREQTGVNGILEQIGKLRQAVYYHKYISMKKYLDKRRFQQMFTECRNQMESLLEELEDLGEIEEVKPKVTYHQMNLKEMI